MAFHSLVHRICQLISDNPLNIRKVHSIHEILNVARFLSSYFTNKSLIVPQHDHLLPDPFLEHHTRSNAQGITLNREHCTLKSQIQPDSAVLLYLAAGHGHEALRFIRHLADVRAVLLLHAAVGDTDDGHDLRAWIDQRLLSTIFTRGMDIRKTPERVDKFVFTEFADLVSCIQDIDRFCQCKIMQLLEARLKSEFLRQWKLSDGQATTNRCFLVIQGPSDSDQALVQMVSIWCNLLLILCHKQKLLLPTLYRLVTDLLWLAPNVIQCNAAMSALCAWLSPLVLELPELPDCAGSSPTLIMLVYAVVCGQLLPDDLPYDEVLTALLRTCATPRGDILAEFLHYCFDIFHDGPEQSDRAQTARACRSQSVEDAKDKQRTLSYVSDVMQLQPLLKFMDTDGLVHLKVTLNPRYLMLLIETNDMPSSSDYHTGDLPWPPNGHSEKEPALESESSRSDNEPVSEDGDLLEPEPQPLSILNRVDLVVDSSTSASEHSNSVSNTGKDQQDDCSGPVCSLKSNSREDSSDCAFSEKNKRTQKIKSETGAHPQEEDGRSTKTKSTLLVQQKGKALSKSKPAPINSGFVNMNWRTDADRIIERYMSILAQQQPPPRPHTLSICTNKQ